MKNFNLKNPIKAVFFDMGGTLEEVYYDKEMRFSGSEVILHVLQQNNLDPGLSTKDFHQLVISNLHNYETIKMKSTMEIKAADFWNKYVFKDINLPELRVTRIAELLTFFLESLFFQRIMRKEVPQVLEEIKQKGLKIGCISNIMGIMLVPYYLQKYGIINYFDTIVLSCIYGFRKPNPKIFHHAAKKVRVEPAQCIYVGDTVSRDIIGSKKANYGLSILIPSFLTKQNDTYIDNELIKPDITIQNLEELLEIL